MRSLARGLVFFFVFSPVLVLAEGGPLELVTRAVVNVESGSLKTPSTLSRGIVVVYTLKNGSGQELSFRRDEIGLNIDAGVSNSSVPGHYVSRASHLHAKGNSPYSRCAVVSNVFQKEDCVEEMHFSLGKVPDVTAADVVSHGVQDDLRVGPGEALYLGIYLEHLHPVYGGFEMLLGNRRIVLSHKGDSILTDDLKVEDYAKSYYPVAEWQPDEKKDEQFPQAFVVDPDFGALDTELKLPNRAIHPHRKHYVRFRYFLPEDSKGKLKFFIELIQQTNQLHKKPIAPQRFTDLKRQALEQGRSGVGAFDPQPQLDAFENLRRNEVVLPAKPVRTVNVEIEKPVVGRWTEYHAGFQAESEDESEENVPNAVRLSFIHEDLTKAGFTLDQVQVTPAGYEPESNQP